jgi:ubiquinone biosynthesis protein
MIIRKIGLIGRTYRHVERYIEILRILFKYGFDDLVDKLRIEQYVDFGRKLLFREKHAKLASLSTAQRLRMALEELGPTFIKFGQMLSTRTDLLAPDFIGELVKLRDEVPPVPYEEAEKVLHAELGDNLADVFEPLDPKPVAAASMAQVYRARLLDGEEVAVKVQRPGIRRIIEVDLEIMLHLAGLMEKHVGAWELQRPTKLVEEFGRIIGRELDFTFEAANMERFASQFLDDSTVYVPKVYREATTERVLTMEYMEGVKSSCLERLRGEGYELRLIARRGADLLINQVFLHGFFHGDPHPGNLLILPGNVICFLDMGNMGRLTREGRENIVDLVLGIAKRDSSDLADALIRITSWEEEPDRKSLEKDTSEFIDLHFYRPLKEWDLGKLLHSFFNIATKHRMRVPADFLLFVKAISAIEGLGRDLDPDFDIIERAAPFVEQVHRERFYPRRILEDLMDSSSEMLQLLRSIPRDLQTIFRMAKTGKLKIEFEHHRLEPFMKTVDRSSNRLSFAVVLASLVIGSSLIIHADIPPKWHNIPLIGLAGYVVAAAMGFWLLISILRRGKM